MKKEEKDQKMTQANLKSIKELRRMAKDFGLLDNPLFETTLSRYETQLQILAQLKEIIDSETKMLVTKEYVKGRKNYYTHPAITEFNKTTDSANKTVACLLKIFKGFDGTSSNGESDPLLEALNGSDDNE